MAQFITYNPVAPPSDPMAYGAAYNALQNALSRIGTLGTDLGASMQNSNKTNIDNNFRLAQAQVKDDPEALKALSQGYLTNGLAYGLSNQALTEASNAKSDGLNLRNSQFNSDFNHQNLAQQSNINQQELLAQEAERNGQFDVAYKLRMQAKQNNPLAYTFGTNIKNTNSGTSSGINSNQNLQGSGYSTSSYSSNNGINGVNEKNSNNVFETNLDFSKMNDNDQQVASMIQQSAPQLQQDLMNYGVYDQGSLGEASKYLQDYIKQQNPNLVVNPQLVSNLAASLIGKISTPGNSNRYWTNDYLDTMKANPNTKELLKSPVIEKFTNGGLVSGTAKQDMTGEYQNRLENIKQSLEGSPQGFIVSKGKIDKYTPETFNDFGLTIDEKDIPNAMKNINAIINRVDQNDPKVFTGLSRGEKQAAVLYMVGQNYDNTGTIWQTITGRNTDAAKALANTDFWSKNGKAYQFANKDGLINTRSKIKKLDNIKNSIDQFGNIIDETVKNYGQQGFVYPNSVVTEAQRKAYIKNKIAPGLNFSLSQLNKYDKDLNNNLNLLENDSPEGQDKLQEAKDTQEALSSREKIEQTKQQNIQDMQSAYNEYNNPQSNINKTLQQLLNDPSQVDKDSLNEFVKKGKAIEPQILDSNASFQDKSSFSKAYNIAKKQQFKVQQEENKKNKTEFDELEKQVIQNTGYLNKDGTVSERASWGFISNKDLHGETTPESLLSLEQKIKNSKLKDTQKKKLLDRVQDKYIELSKF